MREWLWREHPDEDGLLSPWTWAEVIYTIVFWAVAIPAVVFVSWSIKEWIVS